MFRLSIFSFLFLDSFFSYVECLYIYSLMVILSLFLLKTPIKLFTISLIHRIYSYSRFFWQLRDCPFILSKPCAPFINLPFTLALEDLCGLFLAPVPLHKK